MQRHSLEQIKQQVRIEEIVRLYGVHLRGSSSGARFEGRCPFHPGDTTPSLNIYVLTQRYHCFGCGANGDVIDFIQTIEGCTFLDALHRLAEKGVIDPGIAQAPDRLASLKQPLPVPSSTDLDENQWRELLTQTQQHYHQTLLTHSSLPDLLLKGRGITPTGIQRCQLGYADGSWLPYLRHTVHQKDVATTIGLLSATGYERMVGRLIIPECDNEACHWMIGRTLSQAQGRHHTPKYLGLSLSKPVLGYGLALKRMREGHPIQAIVIVEGAIDYVIASQWELPIVCVALIGTAASRRQLAAILELQQRAHQVPLLISLDADDAGRQGSQMLLTHLRQQTTSVEEIAPIAGVKDLGELALQPDGPSVFWAAIKAALHQKPGLDQSKGGR